MDWWTQRTGGGARAAARDGPPSLARLFPDLLVGEYPREEDLAWLKREHCVTAVHNLQDDEDFKVYGLDIDRLRRICGEQGMKLVHTPIPDGSADAIGIRLLDAIEDLRGLIDAGERVYLHCNAGMNRAPTVAIAFMRAHRGMSLNEALAHVKQRRACGPFMTVLEEHFGGRDLKTAP